LVREKKISLMAQTVMCVAKKKPKKKKKKSQGKRPDPASGGEEDYREVPEMSRRELQRERGPGRKVDSGKSPVPDGKIKSNTRKGKEAY